jgi:hypothetical protein
MEDSENELLSPRSAGRGFVFVIGVGALLIGLGAGFLLSDPERYSGTTAILSQAFDRMVRTGASAPAFEIPSLKRDGPAPSSTAAEIEAAFAPPKPSAVSSKPKAAPKKAKAAPRTSKPVVSAGNVPSPRVEAPPLEFPECEFFPASPTHLALIHEIAWMGTKRDAAGEWIELKNNAGVDLDLAGWQLLSEDESLRIEFVRGDVLRAGGYFMLERKNDRALKKIAANRIFEGSIPDRGAWLRLVDDRCAAIDEIDASNGWKYFGGENASKKTLERDAATLGWGTSALVGGTPAGPNHPQIAQKSDPVPAPAPVPAPNPPSEEAEPEDVPSAPPGTVVLAEVMAGTSGSASEEFVELWNPGAAPVDLTGWSLKKRSSNGSETTLVAASRLDGRSIPAGSRFLLANESGWPGSPVPDATWPGSYTLAYSSNAVVLFDASGSKTDELAWSDLPKDQSLGAGGQLGSPTPGR